MKNYIVGVITGCFAMITVTIYSFHNSPTKMQIGHTYQQLKEMKAECEQDLPRATECSIVVYYQPQAELEKTE
jgi:flagellar biosynthesis protein FliR